MRGAAALGIVLLAACDPQAVAEDVNRQAARSVVLNVVVNQYRQPEAEIATDCVLSAATGSEIASLARDVGTRAGTATVATIRTVAARAPAAQCLSSRGLVPLSV